MEWIEVANVIKELGVTIVFVSAVIFLLFKYFSKMIDEKMSKEKLPEQTEIIQYNSVKCLKTLHPFSYKTDEILSIKLPITKIGGPVRTEIFRDVLSLFLSTTKEEVLKMLDEDITLDNFLIKNSDAVNRTIVKYRQKAREKGIPEVVIVKFSEWSRNNLELLLSSISDIDSSDVFETVVEKEYTVLTVLVNTFYLLLIDAEKTLKNLNGDLTGTIYNGKKVENLH